MARNKITTAQDLYNYTKCQYRVYLDSNGDPAEKGQVGPFVKLLWENGLIKEREYIATISPDKVEDLSMYLPDKAFEKTIAGMKAGQEIIYQGCLQADNNSGRPDILLKRTDGQSKFGQYYYEPIDIKAGRGWEERDGKRIKFKEHYAFQVMFYLMLVQSVQGYAPKTGRIVNIEKNIDEFDADTFDDDFRIALASVNDLVHGRTISEPVLGGGCSQCEWYEHCHDWVVKNSDPTGIYFVGSVKFHLKRVGLRTIRDIAEMDVAGYLDGKNKIPRTGVKTLERMKERARVILSGQPNIRPGYTFPAVAREIYFDIEDDPTRGITYLFGMLIRQSGKETHKYFVADRPEDEEQTARKFWDFISKTDDAVYYVYSHKERSTLKQLMARYRLDSAVFDKYVESEFDLYKGLVEAYSDWPIHSYGLKHIAAQIGFKWRDSDPSGANSIAWYNEYLKDPADQSKMQRIIDYNEDDCRAMIALKDYFQKA
ncbi:MAG TPA: TM0106 family RecB-like putative nuclease [Planctomycetota bacterium]|nr:TM0106 family RecB-like putative nuclease [Planctomycetota bacterium]